MVKSGTLIDASLVAADCRRPKRDEPVAQRSDRDASWNAMPEKPLFGYKMHLAVDQGSGRVRQALLTPGHVSDKLPFLDLVQGDEQTVYADRGYDGWWYRQELARRGIADGIMAGDYRQRRSMPPATPAIGRSRRCAGPSSAPSAVQALVRLPPGALPHPDQERPPVATARGAEPTPRPGADRLRADFAPSMAAAISRPPTGHPQPQRTARQPLSARCQPAKERTPR